MAKNQSKMTLLEFSAFCESKGRDWLIKELHKNKQALASANARCEAQRKELHSFYCGERAEKKELEVLRKKADNFNFLLRKLGYNPRKLRIYYKEKGCRDYVRDNTPCEPYDGCDGCDNQYEQDCIGIYVLYDFCFLNGTTYDDYDGFNHSILNGIDSNLLDIDLEDVEKIEDLETNKVIYEVNNDNSN